MDDQPSNAQNVNTNPTASEMRFIFHENAILIILVRCTMRTYACTNKISAMLAL